MDPEKLLLRFDGMYAVCRVCGERNRCAAISRPVVEWINEHYRSHHAELHQQLKLEQDSVQAPTPKAATPQPNAGDWLNRLFGC